MSEHFTLAEMTRTNTKIENVPNEAQVENLKRLCGWLERLRSRYNERYGGLTPDPGLTPNPNTVESGNSLPSVGPQPHLVATLKTPFAPRKGGNKEGRK